MSGNITDELLDERPEKEEKVEKKTRVQKQERQTTPSEKEKDKREEVAFESPQDRFRRIIKDQGYRTGVENLLTVFFDGDTNSPKWLDDVLIMGNIPAKNRELIVTTYYGKTLSELGIIISPADRTKSGTIQIDKDKAADAKKTDVDELTAFTEEMSKEQLKVLKTRYAMAQMTKMIEEMEKNKNQSQQQSQQPSTQVTSMRQITRPIIKDGQMLKDGSGNPIYETINEPVMQTGNGSGGTDILTTIAAIKALEGDKKSASSPEIVDALKAMSEKLVSIEKNSEIQRQEDRIKRLEEERQRAADEYKKDLQRVMDENNRRLEDLSKERVRDLEMLKDRFNEQLNHRKELDNILGAVSSEHKKEMDSIKQKLEHAQTSIERTVVAKGTDTVDKLTGKMADMADSVVKPMVGVMRDHYQLTIDTQRKNLGLPTLGESIPIVREDELEKFVKGE